MLDTLRQLNGLKQRNGFSGKQQFGATRSECLDHDPLSVRPVNTLVIPLNALRCHAAKSFARTPFVPSESMLGIIAAVSRRRPLPHADRCAVLLISISTRNTSNLKRCTLYKPFEVS